MDNAQEAGHRQADALTTVRIDLATVTRSRARLDGCREVEAGSIRGWAVGPEPMAGIDVLLNDCIVTTARIGGHRPDIAALYPGVSHAGLAGFEAMLTSGSLSPTTTDIVLRLRMMSGRSLTVAHPLTLAEERAAPLDQPPIEMMVEDCVLDARGLHVSGWALADSAIVAIQVFAGSDHVATTIPTHARPDVAAMFPDYPNSEHCGFLISGGSLARRHHPGQPIRIEVVTRNGATRSIVRQACSGTATGAQSSTPNASIRCASPVPAAPEQLQFHCDTISLSSRGLLRLAGWAAAKAGVSQIAIAVDGKPVGLARLSLSRPDVRRAMPQLVENDRPGFAFEASLPAPEPRLHEVGFTLTLGDAAQHSFSEQVTPIEAQETGPASTLPAVMLAVDGMQIADDHAARRITGAFHLVGWAAARTGITGIDVFLDEKPLGRAYHGLRREDVAKACPQFPDSLRAGFALAIPSRVLKHGRSRIRVLASAHDGTQAETSFTVEVDLSERSSAGPALRTRMTAAECATHLAILNARGPLPICDLALRLPRRADGLRRALTTVESLGRQAYEHWRLWLSPAPALDGAAIRDALGGSWPDLADRIKLLDAYEPPLHPALVGVLDAGDSVAVDGLIALALAAGPDAGEFVYGDDIRRVRNAQSSAAFFKPDWSPDLLLSQNYIGRAWLARADILPRAGLDFPTLAGLSGYDALLRLTETTTAIRHVPQLVLAAAPSPEAPASERRALSLALRRRGIAGAVAAGRGPGLHRVRHRFGALRKVSIIIPSIAAKGHIRACIASIRQSARDVDYEIIIVDNLGRRRLTPEQRSWKSWFRANADIVVCVDEAFNWSRLNNAGAAAASGDLLLFLNDDIEVRGKDWLSVLAAEAERPAVGVVGAQLLYPDGKVQHAGMVLSRDEIGSAVHAFRFADKDDPSYFGLALSQRNVACVTGACMMMRREVFAEIGGFDEAHGVVNNDVDFCLRLHAAGLLIVYTPHVQMLHHELASRAGLRDNCDHAAFLERWGQLWSEGDPFHNRNLDGSAESYAFEEEPLREVYAGHPLGRHDRIRRILAVKLDHIGDLVTALPALRRLKSHFPHARLDALVGPSAIAIARLEGALDEVIPFAFFEARSGLGRRPLAKRDYAALEDDLKSRRYDLAVDLRKQADTRHILQLSHAPLLAGFDRDRGHPWLDIALEWEGDALQTGKRNHVADDLLNLVDAVRNAFEDNRQTIAPDAALPALPAALAREFAGLFEHDFVVVHAAAGSALRQWPPAHFARLIDLLATRDGMRIALIGGPDEQDIVHSVIAAVERRDAVFDLVGRSRLAELPGILARAALFVGNNSGPSHIASGLGVPTVAVHSAVVASEEWGPRGPAAVALRRDMSCAPCYIVDIGQCHRAMKCLTSLTPHAVHAVCQRFLSLRTPQAPRVAKHQSHEERHGRIA